MALVSVEAVYEDGHIRLLESPPIHGAYRVLVTFVEPLAGQEEQAAIERRRQAFQATFGSWHDDRPIEETLRDLHQSRQSKLAPPEL